LMRAQVPLQRRQGGGDADQKVRSWQLVSRDRPWNHVRRINHQPAILTCEVTHFRWGQHTLAPVLPEGAPDLAVGALRAFRERTVACVHGQRAAVGRATPICFLPTATHLAASVLTPRAIIQFNLKGVIPLRVPAVGTRYRGGRFVGRPFPRPIR